MRALLQPLLACSAQILAAGGDSSNARSPAAGPAAARGGAAAVPMNLNVLPNGLLGFSSFRGPSLLQIPGPGPDGLLLASGVGRSPKGGDAGGLGIVMRRSRDGGKRWEPPMLVGNASELVYSGAIPDGLYNGAALHDHQTNTTFLSWGQCIEKCRPGRAPQHWTAPSYMLTRSTDGFTSWATTNLTATIGAAVNHLFPDNYYGNGLQLRNGHLLMCGSQMDFVNPPPGKKADATDGGFCVSSSDIRALAGPAAAPSPITSLRVGRPMAAARRCRCGLGNFQMGRFWSWATRLVRLGRPSPTAQTTA
jgi:hypothetical protein